MRLLRTTTSDKNAVFTGFLNTDLVIPPYSQIALGQLSTTVDLDSIVIDNNNNKIEFKLLDSGALRTVHITNGTYNSMNAQTLLDDIIPKINRAIGIFDPVTNQIKNGSNIGKQCRVVKQSTGLISFDFWQSKSQSYWKDLENNAYVKNGNKQVVLSGTGNEANTVIKSSNTTSFDNSYLHSTFQSFPICSGVGVHRVRVNTVGGNPTNNAGYTIGLTKTDPASFMVGSGARQLTELDIDYGIRLDAPFSDGNAGPYASIVDGKLKTPSTIICKNAGRTAQKDVVSIEICEGKIRLVIYQEDATNPGGNPVVNVLETIDHDGSKLFATITLHGNSDMLSLGTLKYTPDPFLSGQKIDYGVDDSELGVATPGGQSTKPTKNNTLQFYDVSVAKWLGYDSTNIVISPATTDVSFVGDKIFKAMVENDCYLVELLNLQLESYDTFQEQRKNILALVPYDDTNASKVVYDPNNLVFLDLNNKEQINLTTLKMRLVRSDYTVVEVIGVSSDVIFFRKAE
jgi:hypothetical protein